MATKKKELLEQDAPVTETVMSESETLLVDTAQPESLPADAGDGLDLNELLGSLTFLLWKKLPLLHPFPLLPGASPAPSAARLPSLPSATGMMSRLPKTEMM